MCNIYEGIEETIEELINFYTEQGAGPFLEEYVRKDAIYCVEDNTYHFESSKNPEQKLIDLAKKSFDIIAALAPHEGKWVRSGLEKYPNHDGKVNMKRIEIREKRAKKCRELLNERFKTTNRGTE